MFVKLCRILQFITFVTFFDRMEILIPLAFISVFTK